MFPFLDLQIIQIPMYGLCIVAGILSGGFLAWRLTVHQNINFLDFIIISSVTILFGFIFAKLLYILISFPAKKFFIILFKMLFSSDTSSDSVLSINSGFVFYGGLIGGIPGYFVGTKIAQCKPDDFSDIFAVIIPFVHFFGRLGCFCAGCCYGIAYEGFCSVHYKNPLSDVALNIGIFPVQLVEALLLLILSLILFSIFKQNRAKKLLLYIYLFSYSIIRFFLEYVRGDVARGHFSIFSLSQWISFFVFAISFFIFLKKLQKNI